VEVGGTVYGLDVMAPNERSAWHFQRKINIDEQMINDQVKMPQNVSSSSDQNRLERFAPTSFFRTVY
jgi:hypothetical protein